VDTRSREENASKTNNESFGSDSIRTEIALASEPLGKSSGIDEPAGVTALADAALAIEGFDRKTD